MNTNNPLNMPRGARGSSGAVFSFVGDHVVKTGGVRVAEQGSYIASFNGSGLFPHVYSVYRSEDDTCYYEMERLDDAPWLENLDAVDLVDAYLEELAEEVWCHEADVNFDAIAHLNKMSKLVPDHMKSAFMEVFESINFNALLKGKTHGDPTFDNLMIRNPGAEICIIDPIPATPAVPHLVSVDIGKMYMSLFGFENLRYGITMPKRLKEAREMLNERCGSKEEMIAAHYWCAVHLYRAVPYMPHKEIQNEVRTTADGLISLLASGL